MIWWLVAFWLTCDWIVTFCLWVGGAEWYRERQWYVATTLPFFILPVAPIFLFLLIRIRLENAP